MLTLLEVDIGYLLLEESMLPAFVLFLYVLN